MIKFLDLHHQYLSLRPEIDQAISETIRNSAYIGGAPVQAFESAFAAFQQSPHCVGMANGTDAIEIALEALGLPPGSEVIVPANSFIASSEAVTRSGHKVVFADVDPETYTLSPSDVARRITGQTRAIIAVHLYGHPCDLDALRAVCGTKIAIIEDAAQAHGAEYKGKRVGALGSCGTFSFYPGKNLGAYGDAGALTTSDAELAKRARMIANHGRVSKYDHVFEGRNSRLDGLQAAILTVKLKRLDEWVNRRNEIAREYLRLLADVAELRLPKISRDVRHAFHLFVVRSDRRDELGTYLKAQGIETGVHYPIALPKLQAYRYLGQDREAMIAQRYDAELLSLPIGEHLSNDQIRTVCNAVRAFFNRPSV